MANQLAKSIQSKHTQTGLTLDQIQTFRTIVRARTFSRAAEELYLSQPAVSQRVDHLERGLGVDLFVRNGHRRSLKLTAFGERVLRFADEVMSLYDSLISNIEPMGSQAIEEVLPIACGPTAAKYLLPSLLELYHQSYPLVGVRVSECNGDLVDQAVMSGEAVFGIRPNYDGDGKLRVVPLLRDRLVLVAPPGHPVHADPLHWLALVERCPFVVTGSTSTLRTITNDWARSMRLELQIQIEANDMDAIKGAVMHGFGLALISEIIALAELRSGQLRAVPAPGLPQDWEYQLLYDPERPLSPAARGLLREVRRARWRTGLPVPMHRRLSS